MRIEPRDLESLMVAMDGGARRRHHEKQLAKLNSVTRFVFNWMGASRNHSSFNTYPENTWNYPELPDFPIPQLLRTSLTA